MARLNNILFALCAMFTVFALTTNAFAITEAQMYAWLLDEENNRTFPAEDDEFFDADGDGDFKFPPDYPGAGQHLDDGEIYILIIPEGIDVTFDGSLTIAVNDDEAIGRIQVNGGPGEDMVTLDEAVEDEGWGGISINTDPVGGNLIEYCVVTNAGNNGAAILINGALAQGDVKYCHVHDNGDIGISAAGGDYSIQGNEVNDNVDMGIDCTAPMAGDATPDIAAVNNIVHGNGGMAEIRGEGGFNGFIANNIVLNSDVESGIMVAAVDEDARVINNVIDGDGEGSGISFTAPGDAEVILNNIIVNCQNGIVGPQPNPNELISYNLLFDNNLDFLNCVDDQLTNVLDDPEFVGLGDFHLYWYSPAINVGTGDADPDDSDNDMGAFGGPGADDFNRPEYEDYCLIDDEEWDEAGAQASDD